MQSARLTYHRYLPTDFPKYHALVSENDSMILIFGRALTIEEAKERFDNIMEDNSRSDDLGWYYVRSKVTKDHIGLAKIIFEKEGQAEIGYSLFKEYWGQGYGTEIGQFLTEYGRNTTRLKLLFGIVESSNIPSKNILIKCGFTFECEGNWYDFPGEKYVLNLREPT